jgi:hypothetical protein
MGDGYRYCTTTPYQGFSVTGYIRTGTCVKQTEVDCELTNGAFNPYLINDLTYVFDPPCQLSLWEETGVPGETHDFRQSVDLRPLGQELSIELLIST